MARGTLEAAEKLALARSRAGLPGRPGAAGIASSGTAGGGCCSSVALAAASSARAVHGHSNRAFYQEQHKLTLAASQRGSLTYNSNLTTVALAPCQKSQGRQVKYQMPRFCIDAQISDR